jgi:hypothetical protein
VDPSIHDIVFIPVNLTEMSVSELENPNQENDDENHQDGSAADIHRGTPFSALSAPPWSISNTVRPSLRRASVPGSEDAAGANFNARAEDVHATGHYGPQQEILSMHEADQVCQPAEAPTRRRRASGQRFGARLSLPRRQASEL